MTKRRSVFRELLRHERIAVLSAEVRARRRLTARAIPLTTWGRRAESGNPARTIVMFARSAQRAQRIIHRPVQPEDLIQTGELDRSGRHGAIGDDSEVAGAH